MAKSISIAIIVALTVANLLPVAECNANRGGSGPDEDDFNDRLTKTGGEKLLFAIRSSWFGIEDSITLIFQFKRIDLIDIPSLPLVSAIKRPFFVGSRYGRSEFGPHKLLSVAPRNDRFFLQSRYGKRSMELTTNNFSDQLDRQSEEDDTPLVCLFTGVADLYRCRNLG